MATNAYDVLQARGFIYQCTDDDGLQKLLAEKNISCYIGFDPTAASLHVGSLVPIMALVHLQQAGHRPIIIVGGGTAMVGDPSGRTEMRRLLTLEQIARNAELIRQQIGKYISFEQGRALLLNNAAWLVPLNYIDFLRDIGRHFSVNRMLSAESYRVRLEAGLSFLEFNYMLLQAYDFYVLERDYQCPVQMGGQDQWGNIVAGIDLIRRKSNRPAYGMTFPLITNDSGEKFGKSVAGAVWLDEEKTPPFDFYQFWRNTEDADVKRFLGLFTLLPMDEVNRLGSLQPPLLNRAKEILAYEAVRITHGREKADAAYASALSQFGLTDPGNLVETSSAIRHIGETQDSIIPTSEIALQHFSPAGLDLVDVMLQAGLAPSKSEARRMIKGGGVSVNERKVDSVPAHLHRDDITDGEILIKVGKKRFHRLKIVD
ncbi:MAG: tyrosine--tRNA ligase [Acidobacteria bacterium]|nr:tyrosine--tRNA ligase [Acidobacteriota bacterium]